MPRLVTRILLAVLLMLVPAAALAQGKKVALVVGNSAYQATVPLPNTLNDAQAVAESLARLGFDVHGAFDATQQQLLQTMGSFSKALEGADAAVVFYAGHGIQVDGENYMLPVDIQADSELSIRYGSLSLTDVMREVETRAKVAIVILDACRDNPFEAALAASDPTRSLGASRGLAPMTPTGNGAIVAYAAAAGQVASDGAGNHSPYTTALLEEMERPGVEVGLMFRRVAGKVIESTDGVQRPEVLIRLASEYYLSDVPVAETTVVAEVPVVIAAPQPAPVDVVIVDDFGSGEEEVTPTPDEAYAREVVEATGDRAALWDYTSMLVLTPPFVPAPGWEAPAPKPVVEYEPNSTYGTAQPIEANDTYTMAMSPAGDRDWVRFWVGQGGRLTVRAPWTPAAVLLNVRLVNANYEEVYYWVAAPRPGGELYAEFDIAKPGTYWLELAGGDASQWSDESFELSLNYAVEPDVYEPNGRADEATRIALNGSWPLNILPRGDQDFFRITAPQPGALSVSLTNVPQTIDGAFRLLDANGTEVYYWVSAPRPGGDTVATFDLARPGVYYLQVSDGNSDAADVASLDLTTSFVPSPDTYEPNDTMGHAYPVRYQGSYPLAIFPSRDTDWLELDFVQPGELTIEVKTPPANLDLNYRMLDASGIEVQYWVPAPRPGGDLYGTFDVPRPGRYYLQLADGNSDAWSVEAFNLDLSFIASLDAYEPNDAIGAAKPLTPGGEVPFTILPRGDADWFRVTVEQPGELGIWIDEGPDNLDIHFRVVNADWTELLYWVPPYAKGGLTEGYVDLPRPGAYYIEVRDGNNDDRSIWPAVLRTKFTPTAASYEPNNVYGEATPVELSGETMVHILPVRDADWHVFYADGPGWLDVEISGVPENIDAYYRLLNAERTEIQYWVGPPSVGGVTTGSTQIPAAGWYWMEIRDGNDDARSPIPFTVKRWFRPG
jgi:hypothetical protein